MKSTSEAPKTSLDSQSRWPLLLIPAFAFCLVLPLILRGPSCGHDFGFHLQSWMDAAQQMRQGHLLPRWAFSPAYNAGEPRFIFYPPLSWLLGSLLLLIFPVGSITTLFTWICFTAAGLSLYRLARRYATQNAALLASAIYIANPYLLFTAFERTAYAELLAAAWMPWLFAAALARKPSALRLAVPLALLWLTNAPAAVMGTYAFVLIVVTRIAVQLRTRASDVVPSSSLIRTSLLGLALGLSLPAFYLLPAAWERRYVQIAMAIIPNMRVEDNFLFGHTGYGPHDQVLHTASVVAVFDLVLWLVALAMAYVGRRNRLSLDAAAPNVTRSSLALNVLAVLGLVIAVLLWHFTLPVWHIVPELAFLQFPWRLLSVLGSVLGLAAALALDRFRIPTLATALIGLALASASTFAAIQPFRQGCDLQDRLPERFVLFRSHHGVEPTDEYTPIDADNDALRWDDPAFWLTSNPKSPAPNTVPNPAATIPDYDQPAPLDQTVSGQAPMRLTLHLQSPEDLVLNLRDYATWRITVNGTPATHLERDDGLLAVPLPAGNNTIDIQWHALPDMWAGDALSACAVIACAWLGWRSRRIDP